MLNMTNIEETASSSDQSNKKHIRVISESYQKNQNEALLKRTLSLIDPKNTQIKNVKKVTTKLKFFRPWEGEQGICTFCITKTFFRRKSDLQRHIKTKHSDGSENYNCSFCVEKFTRKDNLTRHLKTMHSEGHFHIKPKCQFCSKRLSRKDAVKRHERSCGTVMRNVPYKKRHHISQIMPSKLFSG